MSTLTPFADMAPVPRVLVDIPPAEFPVGSVTVSLTRTAEGRTFAVRGGQKLPAGSPAVVLDAEAPFGVVSSYTTTGYDASGNVVGSLPAGSVTLDCDLTVIQQPLDARLSVAVDRLWGTARELARPTPFDLSWPQGRPLPGLVGLGPRRGFQGMEWQLVAASHEDADALQGTLGTYDDPQLPVWLVRTPVDWKNPTRTQRIPRVFFCAVSSLVEVDDYRLSDTGEVKFAAVTTEVRPPAVGITAAVLTYADVAVFFGTYSALGAAYGSYSDIKRDTSMIGAASA